jgi:hypothetical protein
LPFLCYYQLSIRTKLQCHLWPMWFIMYRTCVAINVMFRICSVMFSIVQNLFSTCSVMLRLCSDYLVQNSEQYWTCTEQILNNTEHYWIFWTESEHSEHGLNRVWTLLNILNIDWTDSEHFEHYWLPINATSGLLYSFDVIWCIDFISQTWSYEQENKIWVMQS